VTALAGGGCNGAALDANSLRNPALEQRVAENKAKGGVAAAGLGVAVAALCEPPKDTILAV